MQAQGKKLAFLAAATVAVALAVLPSESSAPSAAPLPDGDGDDTSTIPVDCGETAPPVLQIPGGTVVILKQWTDNPPGSHDAEIDALMSAQGANDRMILFWEAVIAQAQDGGPLANYACEGCGDPEACFFWPENTEPRPIPTKFREGSGGGQVWVEAETVGDAVAWIQCTDCE